MAMWHRWATRGIAVLHLVPLLLAASASAIEVIATPKDSRLRVEEQVGIFWLNEETVLYRSFRERELRLIEQSTFSGSDLYRTPRILRSYNIRTREFKDLAETGRDALCYRNGNVLYDKPDNKWPPTYVFGPLGNEQPYQSGTRPLRFIRCNAPDTSHLPVNWPSEVVPLLEEHGFIELRRKNTKAQESSDEPDLFMYPPGQITGTAIQGFRVKNAQNLQWNKPIYAPWKAAYFIFTVGVRDSLPNSGWWLYPDGKTERVDIPMGNWNESSRTSASFEPTSCGLLVADGVSRPRELVFLRQIGARFSAPQRIPVDRHWGWSVSPDGTKVAIVAGATGIPNTNPSILTVVQLCDA